MNLYTIYFNPRDFPEKYVVRRWWADAKGPRADDVAVAMDTLDEARSYIPEGMYNLGRQEEDDPVVVETWI